MLICKVAFKLSILEARIGEMRLQDDAKEPEHFIVW
jgi:hypothetical protein